MFSGQQIDGDNVGTQQRGYVACEKCQAPIEIKRANMVSIEFCVPCQKCGHRGIYFKRMISAHDGSERRTRPR